MFLKTQTKSRHVLLPWTSCIYRLLCSLLLFTMKQYSNLQPAFRWILGLSCSKDAYDLKVAKSATMFCSLVSSFKSTLWPGSSFSASAVSVQKTQTERRWLEICSISQKYYCSPSCSRALLTDLPFYTVWIFVSLQGKLRRFMLRASGLYIHPPLHKIESHDLRWLGSVLPLKNLKLHATWSSSFLWPLINISNCNTHAWCGVALPSPHIYFKSCKIREIWCRSFFQPRIYILKKLTWFLCSGPLLYPSYIRNLELYFSQKQNQKADVESVLSLPNYPTLRKISVVYNRERICPKVSSFNKWSVLVLQNAFQTADVLGRVAGFFYSCA